MVTVNMYIAYKCLNIHSLSNTLKPSSIILYKYLLPS